MSWGTATRLAPCVCAVLVALVACGGGGSLDDTTTGAVGQKCLPDGTCSAGLACLSHRCVAYAAPGNDAGTGVDPTAEVTALARAHCAKTVGCYGVPSGFVDQSACAARKAIELRAALGATGSGWTAPSMIDCAAKTTTATCAEFWAGVACLSKPGTLPNGAPCAFAAQCASFACVLPVNATCGTCAAAKPAGAACANASECAFPLMCSSSVCAAPGAEGSACDAATQLCAFGLSCRNAKCTIAGPDAPCTSTDQDCQTNDFCSSVTNTCQRDAYAVPGAACGWVHGDASLWMDCQGSPGGCIRGDQQLVGTCPQIAADGQPCDGMLARCTHPAVCEKGKCTVPNATVCK